ncbi:MAG: PQQ-binding-like beta-propeller repeat protein, partial [Synergistota bacterium]|nr:PQQ-binding-like beta-propeller repeat protein [Synergistota bacterium]
MKRSSAIVFVLLVMFFSVNGDAHGQTLSSEGAMFGVSLNRTAFSPEGGPVESPGVLWNHSFGSMIRTTPAPLEDMVIIGDEEGVVRGVDMTNGDVVWTHEAGSWVWSSPAVAGNVAVFGTQHGEVAALDARTGKRLWMSHVGGPV